MLSDRDIVKAIKAKQLHISNYKDFKEQLQPASFDFHLGDEIAIPDGKPIDVKKDANCKYNYNFLGITKKDGYTLKAGESILGHTQEKLEIGSKLVAEVTGRSTLGRCFITVHATAGFLDPGFKGQVTLEITNLGSKDFVIYPEMKVGQFVFDTLYTNCKNKYGEESNSHYQNQEGVTLPNLEGLMP